MLHTRSHFSLPSTASCHAAFLLLLVTAGCGADLRPSQTNETVNRDIAKSVGVWDAHVEDAIRASEEGDAVATESHLQSALAVAEVIFASGEISPLLDSLTLLGEFYFEVGRHEDAETRFVRALELAGNVETVDVAAIASVRVQLGACQNEMKKFAEARSNLEAAVPLLAEKSEASSSMLWPLVQLAVARAGAKDAPGTFVALNDLLDVHRQQQQHDYPAVANTLCWLAEVAVQIGKPQEARGAVATAVEFAQQGLLDEGTAAYVYQTRDALLGQAPTERRMSNQWSDVKQAAYEELVAAEQRYLEAKQYYDADMARSQVGAQYARQTAGNLSAMGVAPYYVHSAPPDHTLQMQLNFAKRDYQQAKQKFDQLP